MRKQKLLVCIFSSSLLISTLPFNHVNAEISEESSTLRKRMLQIIIQVNHLPTKKIKLKKKQMRRMMILVKR